MFNATSKFHIPFHFQKMNTIIYAVALAIKVTLKYHVYIFD